MPKRTRRDLKSLVNGHHTNEPNVGSQVYIRRDKDESYGVKYNEGPKSAKPYNHRAKRLEMHGWVEDVDTSHVDPAHRAVGTLTKTGAAILDASYDVEKQNWKDEWLELLDGEVSVSEFIERAISEWEEQNTKNKKSCL